MSIRLGIVDDHSLFTGALVSLFATNPDFNVVMTAANGMELQAKMTGKKCDADIMLVDVNMPHMNGFQTTVWLKQRYPSLKIVALSMRDDELAIINMVAAGCCSYLTKDIHPDVFEKALFEIHQTGRFNGDVNSVNSRQLIMTAKEMESLKLTDKELDFLKHACSRLTYKEIATAMNLSERTVEVYRDHLFAKMKVESRVELCLEAVRLGLVEYRRS